MSVPSVVDIRNVEGQASKDTSVRCVEERDHVNELGPDRISSLMFEGDDEGHEEVRSCLSIAGRPIGDDGNGAVAEPSSNLTRACRMLDLVVSQFSQACTVHDPSRGSIWDFGVLGLNKTCSSCVPCKFDAQLFFDE